MCYELRIKKDATAFQCATVVLGVHFSSDAACAVLLNFVIQDMVFSFKVKCDSNILHHIKDMYYISRILGHNTHQYIHSCTLDNVMLELVTPNYWAPCVRDGISCSREV